MKKSGPRVLVLGQKRTALHKVKGHCCRLLDKVGKITSYIITVVSKFRIFRYIGYLVTVFEI